MRFINSRLVLKRNQAAITLPSSIMLSLCFFKVIVAELRGSILIVHFMILLCL